MAYPANPRPRQSASNLLGNCVAIGLLLQMVGGGLAASQWPRQVERFNFRTYRSSLVHTGHGDLAILGLSLISAGVLVLLVAIIGYGVQLGLRSDREKLASAGASDE